VLINVKFLLALLTQLPAFLDFALQNQGCSAKIFEFSTRPNTKENKELLSSF